METCPFLSITCKPSSIAFLHLVANWIISHRSNTNNLFPSSDFLVFNTIVTDSLLFVSKSVCNDSIPLPSSSLSRWMPGIYIHTYIVFLHRCGLIPLLFDSGLFVPGRAVLHFGIRVSGERDRGGAQGGCLVESFNYAANLNIPDVMNYAFNAQQFYPDLLNRLLQKYNVSDNS